MIDSQQLTRRGTILVLLLVVLAGCGGKEHIRKPIAEGPDIHIAILTCNLDRVKALVEDDSWIAVQTKYPTYGYPLEDAVGASRICGTSGLLYLLENGPSQNVLVLNAALVRPA